MIDKIVKVAMALKMFGGSSEAPRRPLRQKTRQERPLNILITIALAVCMIFLIHKRNLQGIAMSGIMLVLHNVFPDGYIHTGTWIYAGFGVVLTSLFYTIQALMQVMGYKPKMYTLKQIKED